jgi:hypothetical protein
MKAGRICEGYQLPIIASRTTAAARFEPTFQPSTLLSAFRATASEWQAYEYYTTSISSVLGGACDNDVWKKLVLQVAAEEPTVRQGLFALGYLFRHGAGTTNAPRDCNCRHCQRALKYYNRSIQSFSDFLKRPSSERSRDVALLSCTIFICLEFYRMNDGTGISLISQGCNMIGEATSDDATSINPRLIKLFDRLWLLASMFGHHQRRPLPAPPNMIDGIILAPCESIEDARDYLHEITTVVQDLRLKNFRAHLHSVNDEALAKSLAILTVQQDKVLHLLSEWKQHFDALAASYANPSKSISHAFGVFRVKHMISRMRASDPLNLLEMRLHDRTEEYAELVAAAGEVLSSMVDRDTSQEFSFEIGFLPGLYLTTLKCRDSGVRRRALELMCLAKAKEGLWQRSELVTIAARVIELEEGLAVLNMPDETEAERPPRFDDVLAGLNYTKNGTTYVDVTYFIYDPSVESRVRYIHETLTVRE